METKQFTIKIARCLKCEAIISTSLHLLDEVRIINSLIFSQACIYIDPEIIISLSPFDKYCTYQKVLCSICHFLLGKRYKALTENLTELFNTYLIEKNTLIIERKSLEQNIKFYVVPEEDPHNNCLINDKKEIQIECKSYNPILILESLSPYDEYQIMKQTLQLADKNSRKFTNALLKIEDRMIILENKCKEISCIFKSLNKLV